MNHRQNHLLSTSNFIKFYFYILPFTSFFLSLYQLNQQYDGFHHGLIFSITEDFISGKIPYKDFFPHYGMSFIVINSIFIKIFSNSIYGTYFLIALCHGITFVIFGMIIKKIYNEKIAVSSMTMMFFLHPLADLPWPDYVFFSFILISFYILIITKNNFLILLSGFFYSIAGLTKDNLSILLFFCIILYCISLFYLKYIKKKIIYNNFINIYWFFGYLIPLIIFILYLKHNLILYEYLNHFEVSELVIKYVCNSETDLLFLRIFDCGLIAVMRLFEVSITKILTEPYWLFFLLIIIMNIFFIVNVLFFEKEKIINGNKKLMIWISILSLILFSTNFYHLAAQKLFTGVSIGMIVLIYLIQNIKSPVNKYFLYCVFFAFLINGIQFTRTPNNRIYPTFSDNHYNYSNNIEFLKFKRLSNPVWRQLNEFESFTETIINHCSFIHYSTNLTLDVFYRTILKQNFELLNFIPFAPRTKFHSELYNKFDPNFNQNLKREIDKKNIVIAIDSVSKRNLELKNNPNLYLVKSIQYNGYGTKFINIYLPINCKI